jgi:3-phenylpropionate/cinnamic acid dioxygenase small subunit
MNGKGENKMFAFDIGSDEYQKISREGEQFLLLEAEILDSGRYKEWLNMLTDDIVYQIPIRITRERHASSQFSDQSWHMNEDKGSLDMRIARVYTDYNWVEDPPSRSRHFLTNFRIKELRVQEHVTEVLFRSNLLLFRNKFDHTNHDLVSAERQDLLRKDKGVWKLANRLVLLDHTTMGMSNLGVFL